MDDDTIFEPDDGSSPPKRLGERSEADRRQYTLCLAHALFLNSYPDKGAVYPAGDPSRCFVLAEEFVAEAVRRGY